MSLDSEEMAPDFMSAQIKTKQRPVPAPRKSLGVQAMVSAPDSVSPEAQTSGASARTTPKNNKPERNESPLSNSPVSSSTSTIGDLHPFAPRPLPKVRTTLTPPLPRPLLPPPSPPVKKRTMDVPPRPPPPIIGNKPALDLSKLSLKFADDDEAISRLRLRTYNPDSKDSDEEEDFRLSVLDRSGNHFVAETETEDEFLCFCGWVTLDITGKKKEVKKSKRNWLSLRGDNLVFYHDEVEDSLNFECKTSALHFVGIIDEKIHLVCKLSGKKSISTVTFLPEENLDFWLLTLVKSTCQNQKFVRNVITSALIGGKVFIQQASTENWVDGWACVQNRTLQYYIPHLESFFELDLRKTKMIQKNLSRNKLCPFVEQTSFGSIQISVSESCVLLQCSDDEASEAWYDSLFSLYRNAKALSDYLLTSDNVPVIVDRCIQYVSMNGLLSKGLYRKNASASACKTLLKDFKENPFTFKIMKINDETSNVAADTMRNFFRQLPEPLIPSTVHNMLYRIKKDIPEPHQRSQAYRTILNDLPIVNYRTLNRLMEHLVEVSKHSNENLASMENLAKVFAPTAFKVQEDGPNNGLEHFMNNIQVQISVMLDLLVYFKEVFPPSPQQILFDNKVEQIKNITLPEEVHSSRLVSVVYQDKSFRVPSNYRIDNVIQYFTKELGHTESNYAIYECHAEGNLRRRCALDEVLDYILIDRWDRFPFFKTGVNLLLVEVEQEHDVRTNAFAENVMFSDAGSKKFRTCNFKVDSGVRIVCLSTRMKELVRWDLKDTVWFEGVDDRTAPRPYTITFFCLSGPHEHKIKYRYQGNCLSFSSSEDLKLWLNCIQICLNERHI